MSLLSTYTLPYGTVHSFTNSSWHLSQEYFMILFIIIIIIIIIQGVSLRIYFTVVTYKYILFSPPVQNNQKNCLLLANFLQKYRRTLFLHFFHLQKKTKKNIKGVPIPSEYVSISLFWFFRGFYMKVWYLLSTYEKEGAEKMRHMMRSRAEIYYH